MPRHLKCSIGMLYYILIFCYSYTDLKIFEFLQNIAILCFDKSISILHDVKYTTYTNNFCGEHRDSFLILKIISNCHSWVYHFVLYQQIFMGCISIFLVNVVQWYFLNLFILIDIWTIIVYLVKKRVDWLTISLILQ